MIIRSHGGLELLAIIWTLTLVACAQNETESNINTQNSTNITEISNDNSTIIENTEKFQGQSVLEDSLNGTNDIEGLVKSQRRAARFDTPGSPWVRVYNRPPGTKSESYFNYDTRSNTSAHTSGEGWDSFRKEKQNAVAPINRRESKTKVQDILRVKPKVDTTPSPKRQDVPETSPSTTQSAETSTEEPIQISTTAVPAKNDSQNKGYIIWSSNDGGPSGGWTFENPKEQTVKKIPIADEIIPKDGTHWKVIGEGGEDGWQVVDDKGDVEWKIEYDDGEWRVTSTGDIPADAEWVDPEYVWGPAEGSLSDEDEYNSWSADDYAYSPWVDPVVYVRGIGNQTWPTSDGESQIVKSSEQAPTSGQKTADAIKDFLAPKEPIRFGVRRKIPEKDTSNSQENLNEIKRDTADDTKNAIDEETPQADQLAPQGKSWVSTQPAIKTGQKWIQGYGTKSWEVDNTGKNSGYGGETWITANKDFPNSPWVPKTATGQIQETSKDVNTATQDVKLQDNPIRAWGTGYGSKTWKGNEWDSNVVWKTGFGGALPWTTENSTWKFPDQTNEDSQDKDKKSIVWSQPIPSEDDEPVSNSKSVNQPGKSLNNIRIKWPTKPTNVKWKTPPSRRTEDESWGDDSSEGGVIWKDQSTEPTPTDAPIGESPVKPNLNINFNKGWQSSGWLNNQDVDAKPITFTWKNKPPQKTSNLISVNWKSDESVTNPPPTPAPAPVAWNQGQWPAVNQGSFPNWIFGGCKLTIKCGSSESDTNEDDSIQTTPQDTSDDTSAISTDAPTTTAIIKGWPVHQFKGKSWRPPPTKSWRPPPSKSWKPPKKSSRPPTPPSTMPDTPPPTAPPNMGWKNPGPPPNVMWKKPQPPPGWKQPPSGWKQPPTPPPTTPWIESTTMPPPSMSWKPPPSPPPSSMKWKKPGPRPPKSWRPPPTKSWKPPPTKSWKPPTGPGKSWQPPTGPGKSWQPPTGPGKSWQPPTGPGKSWQPSIATPAPDSWSTPTKPDCKDSSEPAQPSPEPNPEDEEQEINPPQIIIITKLPNNQKGPMPSTDKWDTRNDRKSKKPPSKSKIPNKSWIFPSRKVSQKSNKNQKDMTGRMVGKWPIRPRKVSKPGNKIRGWPKGMPLPNFTWPANNMRRLTTKRPTSMNTWKPQKYMKSKAWRQILKKWMKARM